MSQPHKAIVSVTNDLLTDNRVDKVCRFLVDQGYSVTLVGRQLKNSLPLNDRPYATKRFRLIAERGPLFYASYNFRLFIYLLFHRSALLVSNDLDTLLANFLASKFKRNCRLVYDSHEYFTEVPELIHRPKVQRIWEKIEGWIFPKLTTIYTVNESIAELYAKKYNKSLEVVRNVSPLWKSNEIPSKAQLGIPTDRTVFIIQGAGINIDRGAEEVVEAMADLADAVLLIVGDGDVVPQLKQRVQELKIEDRVLFFGKRPYHEMMAFTFHADVGLTLDKPNNTNYRFSLPNKVFDYMHAQTAIIATDLVEIRKLVDRYQLGWVLTEFSTESLRKVMQQAITEPLAVGEFKRNAKEAAVTENWENEREVLAKIYPKVHA
jgi:glycosyltransferase involved in cell wall biosynthesis